MQQAAPLPMCPMAKACRGMAEKPFAGVVMIVPGLAFIALGVAIAVWPSVLPWLVAGMCILLGVGMLLMASFMRAVGARMRRAGG